ncbi:MAG: hypothetical protein AAFY60_22465, partial [Myxococcota bacterium]
DDPIVSVQATARECWMRTVSSHDGSVELWRYAVPQMRLESREPMDLGPTAPVRMVEGIPVVVSVESEAGDAADGVAFEAVCEVKRADHDSFHTTLVGTPTGFTTYGTWACVTLDAQTQVVLLDPANLQPKLGVSWPGARGLKARFGGRQGAVLTLFTEDGSVAHIDTTYGEVLVEMKC